MNRNSYFLSLLFNACLAAFLLYLVLNNQIAILEKITVAKGIAIAILAIIFIYAICYLVAEFLVLLAVFVFVALAMTYYFNHDDMLNEIKFKDNVKKEKPELDYY